ncbi:cysteine desulfurase-like protein [Roseisolibacter sp. H3M3-2]|uniref:cysteine desulfurase-like protein n=1 Tax=Roseisolibacter sp. H3M3-2 TaxID=3031323 RepID=UPI0023D9A6CE|nr:cysteine desulfurase-like protein [Roseisolibacter sp. H3M3-2]MDF1502925.1 cysteine desulfurase-like protein [Roseisolibacter sp. H3M3-2]
MSAADLAHAADALDVAAVRAAFPALQRVHGGHPVAYFDGPGGTQVPRAVVDAMADYLLHHNANTHWAYPTSVETDAVITAAREAAADLLGGAPGEIVFGHNMTTLAFHLARALRRGGADVAPFGPGDEVVVTELDHHANVAPWRTLAQECGGAVRVARLDPATGTLDWDHLAAQLGPRTRLLAIGAASNALGTQVDVAAAARLARGVGALTFVDGVHAVPHLRFDVRALAAAGVDFVGCSAYKFYGPHAGLLWGRAELLAGLDVPKLAPAPSGAPERFETGTQNHEGMAGTSAAVDFLASLGDDAGAPSGARRERLGRAYGRLHAAGSALLAPLWEGLRALPDVTLYGPPPGTPRTPTVSFTVGGVPSRQVARALAARGVFVSHGDFYAQTVAERLGVAGAGFVRAGCAAYTTAAEVERLVDGVAALVRA